MASVQEVEKLLAEGLSNEDVAVKLCGLEPNKMFWTFSQRQKFSETLSYVEEIASGMATAEEESETQPVESTPQTAQQQMDAAAQASNSVVGKLPYGPTSMLEHALDALRRGYYVFPCVPGGKVPAGEVVPNGHLNASNDPDQIRAWWKRNPDYNPAVALEPSNKTGVDYDTVAPFLSTHGQTFCVKSGRINPPGRDGGYHDHYEGTTSTRTIWREPVLPIHDVVKTDDGGVTHTIQYDALDRKIVKGKVKVGEVRSRGAYVIWNGALHSSGRHYEILHDVPLLPWEENEEVQKLCPAKSENFGDLTPAGTEKLENIAAHQEENFQKSKMGFKPRKPYQGGFLWLIDCPFAYNHDSETKLIENGGSSCAVIMLPNGALTFKCHHSSCDNQTWADLRTYGEQQAGEPWKWDDGKAISCNQEPDPAETARYQAQLDAKPGASAPVPTSTDAGFQFKYPAVPGTHRDYVAGPLLGQKDGWCPRGDVHIINGPSGANKTTAMMEFLEKQLRKENVYGHQTYGLSYLTLMFDRGENAFKRTMERMNLDPDKIPVKRLSTATGYKALTTILEKIEECGPDHIPQIVFIEGGDMLVEDPSDGNLVDQLMEGLQSIAKHYHISIILSVGSPKMRIGEGYIAKRDSCLGSEKWGRKAETIIAMQFVKGDDIDSRRVMFVLVRNGPPERFDLTLKGGMLVPFTQEELDSVKEQSQTPEIGWFKRQAVLGKTDPEKRWWTALDLERGMNKSRATARRWIADALTKGYIVTKPGPKVGKGSAPQYQWNESETNRLWVDEQAKLASVTRSFDPVAA